MMFRNPWHPKKVYGKIILDLWWLQVIWLKLELDWNSRNGFWNNIYTYCPYFENVVNSVAGSYFWAKDLENTFQDEAMAKNGDKNGFITKEIWFFQV